MTIDRTGEEITKPYLSPNNCPLCDNITTMTKGAVGDWVNEYTCTYCKSVIEFNEGDKMGGQFDTITILKDNYNADNKS